MLLDEGMDTGKILVTKTIAINPDETTPSLTDRLINLSDSLLQEYIPQYINGTVTPRQQSHPDRATYSRKLTKEDGTIDWTKPADVIEREVRAFIEWPKSRTTLAGKEVIVTTAHVLQEAGPAGKTEVRGKEVVIYCGKDALVIDRLKPAGKNEMTSEAFLAGHKHLL
jgi:methionyl-tRNA formyltransferase